MTSSDLLRCLCSFLEESTKDLLMPVALQKEDVKAGKTVEDQVPANIYQQRLPNNYDLTKITPYILARVIHGEDGQSEGEDPASIVVVRLTFTVYNQDEPEGELMLINLIERARQALEKTVVIGNLYTLDLSSKLTYDVYDGIKYPYYAGEMITTWQLPPIEREDVLQCL